MDKTYQFLAKMEAENESSVLHQHIFAKKTPSTPRVHVANLFPNINVWHLQDQSLHHF